MDDNTKNYIQAQLDSGQLPTQIVEGLVASGWQEAQATMAVQQVSGVTLATTGGFNGYTKPPIILQILFALSILGLLFGIFYGVVAVSIFASDSELVLDEYKNVFAGITAMVSVILIAGFFLVKSMRAGSLSALKIYTGLVLLGLVLNIAGLALAENSDESTGPVASSVILSLIILYIWKRHRLYFR